MSVDQRRLVFQTIQILSMVAVNFVENFHPVDSSFLLREVGNRSMIKFCLCAGLMFFAAGCGQSSPSPVPGATEAVRFDTEPSEAGDVQLVTLSLPNMTCPICAKEIQNDLAKLDGVSVVETDVSGKSCKFKLGDKELDLEAKLEALAADNESLKGFKIVKK